MAPFSMGPLVPLERHADQIKNEVDLATEVIKNNPGIGATKAMNQARVALSLNRKPISLSDTGQYELG